MTIQIDLHTHSTVSDGTLTPYELVNQAIAAEQQVLSHEEIVEFVKNASNVSSAPV